MAKKRKVNLDDVLVTPDVRTAWEAVVSAILPAMALAGVVPGQVPTESLELLEDGSLRMFVVVPLPTGGVLEPELIIPPGQWAWRPGLVN
jgi:hypothetical protein